MKRLGRTLVKIDRITLGPALLIGCLDMKTGLALSKAAKMEDVPFIVVTSVYSLEMPLLYNPDIVIFDQGFWNQIERYGGIRANPYITKKPRIIIGEENHLDVKSTIAGALRLYAKANELKSATHDSAGLSSGEDETSLRNGKFLRSTGVSSNSST